MADPTARQLATRFFDEQIRIENIIWLAGNMDVPNDALTSLLDDGDVSLKELSVLLGVKVTQDLAATRSGRQELLSQLARADRTGFLVQVATPVLQSISKGGAYTTHGFGHFIKKWFYADAIDTDLIDQIFAWRKKFISSERRRLGRAA